MLKKITTQIHYDYMNDSIYHWDDQRMGHVATDILLKKIPIWHKAPLFDDQNMLQCC